MSTQNVAIGGAIAEPDAGPGQLLNVRQVAQILGASERHVLRLAKSGRMPAAMKIGHLSRWSRRAVNAWIDARCPEISRG